MKTSSAVFLSALALLVPAITTTAQDADESQPRPQVRHRIERRDVGEPGRPGEGLPPRDDNQPRERRTDFRSSGHQKMPPPPLMGALDANHDGVIDQAEITNASDALKKLDKNGDGQLSMDEIRPLPPQPRPPGSPLAPPQLDREPGVRMREQRFRDDGDRGDRRDLAPRSEDRAPRRAPRPPEDAE